MSAPAVPPHKGRTGPDRLWYALRYTGAGLSAAWRHEAAFREEVVLAALLIPAALLLRDTAVERALMIGSVLLVPLVELINSAIEATVDRVSAEAHPLAKRAKDLGSAAVFIALVNAVVVWALLLLGA